MPRRNRNGLQERMQQEVMELQRTSGLPEDACSTLIYADGEEYTVAVIKRHLRTPEQKVWLDAHDLSIEDLLNGRYQLELATEVAAIYDSWNIKLGKQMFGSQRA